MEESTETAEGYEIVPYGPSMQDGVVDLLKYLWGDNKEGNLSYFKWRYDENPYADSPAGIVALHKGEVAGFRGYFATRWQVAGRNNNIIILCPGDTCVHPAHRLKGLSVKMGKAADREYSMRHKIFFNFSSTKKSMPGYRKMGFYPLVNKSYLTRYSLPGLVRFVLQEKKVIMPDPGRVAFGKFGDVLVSDRPMPGEMSAVIAGQNQPAGRITLFQGEDFFRWRFNNGRNRYLFYYHIRDGITAGYVVTGMLPGSQRGYILDHAADEKGSLEAIFRHIINADHFDMLSAYDFSLNDSLSSILEELRFKKDGMVQKGERYLQGECPLFIRPIDQRSVEEDWFIEGIDVRDISNWEIKGICSDFM